MSQESVTTEAFELDDERVRDYLLNHPNFFNQHPDLVEKINIKDRQQGVVSLTMRQLSQLRDKNDKLQHQLDHLLEIARENDALFGRMQQLTAALIEVQCIEDVFATLDDALRDCFSADFFALRLISDDFDGFPIGEGVWETASEPSLLFTRLFEKGDIKCGTPTHDQAEALFGEKASEVHSAAMMPIITENVKALLVIGSLDGERFHPTMGTLFLSHLSDLVAKRLSALIKAIED